MAPVWSLTLPAVAVVGAAAASVSTTSTLGVTAAAVAAIGLAAGLYAAGRRNPVHAGNVNELPAARQQAGV
ncbi:hypothetical protein FAF44_44225 [Nonomuraea sp. MG754425]|uniref:hypothetical protein n=1 Tax=Nonomuraea sp. MG754425 TaxID=2570319 RepID=UPI001F3619C3|nr:hypothetical protein [Nonomuraea sp. MG754425]MCF6475321.1 hypothetical protein [Nonomuraea sp. MG754425]